ncbi:S-adenosyl-L-methionine-dependent methyltransferase [Haematococcus lacustris]
MSTAQQQEAEERRVQKRYWAQHTPPEPNLDTMMLDSAASTLDALERPEVLSILGSVAGKRVLELGAGIGRFTGELCAAGAAHVVALDFMEASIQENKRRNGRFSNVEFRTGDVTELELPPDCCDVIFSNWLLMYLSDHEVERLAARMLQWVSPGGVIFFRESCFKQSGDKPRTDNPTHYRNPREYFRVFDQVRQPGVGSEPGAQLQLLTCKCVDTYVKVKRNQNQLVWKWVKVASPSPQPSPPAAPLAPPSHTSPSSLRHFLDSQQYSQQGVETYQAIYGPGHMSCGGEQTARQLASLLQLQPGQRVLDVGCGTGGSAYLLAEGWGVRVHGLDLSVNCLLAALDKASTRSGDVSFEVADMASCSLAPCAYDALLCRDTLMHVQDKAGALERFHSWLKPGGRLLLTDYCLPPGGAPDLDSDTASYLAARRYHLVSLEAYEEVAVAAGFTEVVMRDQTDQFVVQLQRELAGLRAQRPAFTAAFGVEAFDACQASWEGKLRRALAGQQRWVLLTALKAVTRSSSPGAQGPPSPSSGHSEDCTLALP